MKLAYTYTLNSLPATITETDGLGVTVAVTSFTYDSRSRLTREYRTLSYPYDLTYEYDQGGEIARRIRRRPGARPR